MTGRWRAAGLAAAIVAGVGSIAMLAAGANPIDGFAQLFGGALGDVDELAETLVQTTALLFPALGVAIAFRAGLFNIGAEGQLVMGGLAAGSIGAVLTLPGYVSIPLLLMAGALAGGGWGAFAGFLRARFAANEVITTLMLNVVATLFASYLVGGPLKSPAATASETAILPHASWLPELVRDTRLTLALPIALLVALGLRYLLDRTVFGYELRAVGEAPKAARRAGIAPGRIAIAALGLSGAIAGMGGATIVLGILHRFNVALSPGYGFIAIAVALVGNCDPIAIVAAAFAFGILQNGALAMQAGAGVPRDIVAVVEGLVIFVLAGRQYLTRTVAQ
ncbi:MAG TPA: ABC transporter permease [Candidatus Binatia bacterium]|nr:ABC transporter permease [Candidatus Binatia bacterium]